MSRHRVVDEEDPADTEENTVEDQLSTVDRRAADVEEACPRQVGSGGMQPQRRLETRRRVEERHAASEARDTSTDAAPRTSRARAGSRGR